MAAVRTAENLEMHFPLSRFLGSGDVTAAGSGDVTVAAVMRRNDATDIVAQALGGKPFKTDKRFTGSIDVSRLPSFSSFPRNFPTL